VGGEEARNVQNVGWETSYKTISETKDSIRMVLREIGQSLLEVKIGLIRMSYEYI